MGSKDLGEGFFLDGGLGKVLDRAKLVFDRCFCYSPLIKNGLATAQCSTCLFAARHRTPYFTQLNCKGSWNDRFTPLPFPLPTHSLLAFSGLAARTREAAGVAAASQAAPPWPPARSPSGGSPPPTHLTRGAGSCLTGDSNRRLEARDLGLPEVRPHQAAVGRRWRLHDFSTRFFQMIK